MEFRFTTLCKILFLSIIIPVETVSSLAASQEIIPVGGGHSGNHSGNLIYVSSNAASADKDPLTLFAENPTMNPNDVLKELFDEGQPMSWSDFPHNDAPLWSCLPVKENETLDELKSGIRIADDVPVRIPIKKKINHKFIGNMVFFENVFSSNRWITPSEAEEAIPKFSMSVNESRDFVLTSYYSDSPAAIPPVWDQKLTQTFHKTGKNILVKNRDVKGLLSGYTYCWHAQFQFLRDGVFTTY